MAQLNVPARNAKGPQDVMTAPYRKKLIEVALPLEAINKASAPRRNRSGTAIPARCTCGGRGGLWRPAGRCSSRRWWTTRRRIRTYSRPGAWGPGGMGSGGMGSVRGHGVRPSFKLT